MGEITNNYVKAKLPSIDNKSKINFIHFSCTVLNVVLQLQILMYF